MCAGSWDVLKARSASFMMIDNDALHYVQIIQQAEPDIS